MIIGMWGTKALPLHTGHINCIIEASNKCDILYVILSYSKFRDKNLCDKYDFRYIQHTKRLQWLDQVALSLPNVKVFSIEDEDDEDYNSWEDGANKVIEKVKKDGFNKIDIVFGSETEYKNIFESLYENSVYEMLDSDRIKYPISATTIRREGVFKNWEFIPKICRSYYNKKVMVVGTEATGKSTMVKKLALKYNTEFVSEYGRTMCEKLNTGQPTEEYYPYIAYGQKMEEFNKNELADKLLFIDTDSIVTQFYSELYAQKNYEVLDKISETHSYDLWLFLETDVKWVDDGLRIHGKEVDRKANNIKLKSMLDNKSIKYHLIKGTYEERYNSVIDIIQKELLEKT